MGNLAGMNALITGGTSGIGLATAKHFLADGARVVVTGHNPQTLSVAARELGNDAIVLDVDASDPGAQAGLAAQLKQRIGQLDVVFVNAGIGDFRPLANWDEAGFDRVIATNLKGPFFLIKELVALMKNPSSIILNASVNAHIGMPNSSVYAASKAALLSLARTLSAELISLGIRVNAISPGAIATPIYGKLGLTADQLQQMSESLQGEIPAKRFGDPSEIAKAVAFLASPDSAYMIGSEVIIDGGFSTL